VLGDLATIIECTRSSHRDAVVTVPRAAHGIVDPRKRTPHEKARIRTGRYVAAAGVAVSDANDARHRYLRNESTSPLRFDSERSISSYKRPDSRGAGFIASLACLTR